jgi:cold shock CspA family protein
MAILTTKAIAALISQLEVFSYECPECPTTDIITVIRSLFVEYQELISGKEKAYSKHLSSQRPRIRRKLKKFPFHTPAHVRILANIVKHKKTGCWLWPGAGTTNYGTVSVGSGKQDFVHRVMYEYANHRRLKPGEVVRHTCDNGFCCNPSHLVVGTQVENAQDRVSRNRSAFQKLTYATAKKIHIRYIKGETARKLAEEFKVSLTTVQKLGKEKFKTLSQDPDVRKLKVKVGHLRRSKLTPADVRVIRERLKRGDLQKDIARTFAIDETVISGIKRGRVWNGVK